MSKITGIALIFLFFHFVFFFLFFTLHFSLTIFILGFVYSYENKLFFSTATMSTPDQQEKRGSDKETHNHLHVCLRTSILLIDEPFYIQLLRESSRKMVFSTNVLITLCTT